MCFLHAKAFRGSKTASIKGNIILLLNTINNKTKNARDRSVCERVNAEEEKRASQTMQREREKPKPLRNETKFFPIFFCFFSFIHFTGLCAMCTVILLYSARVCVCACVFINLLRPSLLMTAFPRVVFRSFDRQILRIALALRSLPNENLEHPHTDTNDA